MSFRPHDAGLVRIPRADTDVEYIQILIRRGCMSQSTLLSIGLCPTVTKISHRVFEMVVKVELHCGGGCALRPYLHHRSLC